MTVFDLVTIGSLCEPVRRVDPMLLGSQMFRYIDLSSVDQQKKYISEARELPSDEAPGRARQLIQAGDVLVSTVRPNLNAVALVGNEHDGAVASTGFCVLRPRPDLVVPEFVFAWVQTQSFIKDVSSKAQGASYPAVTDRVVAAMTIPLPPLAEQKRIAAKVEALLESADHLESVYLSAITRADEAVESEVSAAIRVLGENFEQRSLGNVLDIARGGSPRPISDFITDDPNGVNWVKIGDASVSRKYIYETAEKIKPSGVKRSRMVYPGDLLLSNSMSFGRPYIMRTEGCIHDGWLVLRDKNSCFDQDYLYYLLGSRTMYREFSQRAQGSTVQNLNSALVSDVPIPVPPRHVQEDFAKRVHTLEEEVHQLKLNLERRLDLLSNLRQSVLEAAFRGEL
jgi:type I restriction enzyme S subunit